MKIFGTILLWLGFLSGSLATVFHPPASGVKFAKKIQPSAELRFELADLTDAAVGEDGWHLIQWPWFLISASVCLSGVVLIRIGNADAQATESEKASANIKDLKYHLLKLIENADDLHHNISSLAPSKITGRIDDVLADDFRAFADGREALVPEYGLTVYADIMTHFAGAERTINRAWSAAADGYVDEAATCVERGLSLLRDALSELERAGKAA